MLSITPHARVPYELTSSSLIRISLAYVRRLFSGEKRGFFHVMPHTDRRWVPTYAVYRVIHDGHPALVVQPGFDDRKAPNRRAFRESPGHLVDDSKIVERLTALAAPETTIERVLKFVLRYGALGDVLGKIPEPVATHFPQSNATLHGYTATLAGGVGAPEVNLHSTWPLVTVSLYRTLAEFLGSLITLHDALRNHGVVPWPAYSRRRNIARARSIIAAAGFSGGNVRIMAALEEAPPPKPSPDPELDDYAHFLASCGDDMEDFARTLVHTGPYTLERVGPIDERGRAALSRAKQLRAWKAAFNRARLAPDPAQVTLERFQKETDSQALESAVSWLVSSAAIQVAMARSTEGFSLRYAPINAWQAAALAVAHTFVQSGADPLRGCRLCGSAFVPVVGAHGGRPRTLCERCYEPRKSKTVSERRRREQRRVVHG